MITKATHHEIPLNYLQQLSPTNHLTKDQYLLFCLALPIFQSIYTLYKGAIVLCEHKRSELVNMQEKAKNALGGNEERNRISGY